MTPQDAPETDWLGGSLRHDGWWCCVVLKSLTSALQSCLEPAKQEKSNPTIFLRIEGKRSCRALIPVKSKWQVAMVSGRILSPCMDWHARGSSLHSVLTKNICMFSTNCIACCIACYTFLLHSLPVNASFQTRSQIMQKEYITTYISCTSQHRTTASNQLTHTHKQGAKYYTQRSRVFEPEVLQPMLWMFICCTKYVPT